MRRPFLPRAWLGLCALAALAACDRWQWADTVRPVNPTRGYVLISIDTLRADHLGLYGYEKPTSPFLDSLATRATVFEHAIVQLPGTLPSHMSMFTGLYPPEHGVYPPDGILSEQIATLPEVLRRNGFRTAGFTEGGYVAGRYGFARGFDKFSDEAAHRSDDVEATFARGVDFLESIQPGERFFLFLHTYSVHDPYEPPERYRALFAGDPPADAFAPTGVNLSRFNQGQGTITPEALEYYKALYDAEIRYTDDVLAGFFAALARLGLDQQTTIVITSDHGEEFLDHGKMVHEQVYHELLHVPLLVVHPYTAPARIDALVQSIDLAPTFYDLARVRPPAAVSGVSLVPYIAGRRAPLRQEAHAEAFVTADHATYHADGDEIHHLIVGRAPAVGGIASVGRVLRFDWPPDGEQIAVRAFRQPRRVRVSVDDQPLTEIALTPDQWTALPLADVPPERRGRIRLEADGCVSPSEVSDSQDTRCLAVQVQGGTLKRRELYDIRRDPAEQHDLARERSALAERITQTLLTHRVKPVGTARQDLDPALRERLRALGYLE